MERCDQSILNVNEANERLFKNGGKMNVHLNFKMTLRCYCWKWMLARERQSDSERERAPSNIIVTVYTNCCCCLPFLIISVFSFVVCVISSKSLNSFSYGCAVLYIHKQIDQHYNALPSIKLHTKQFKETHARAFIWKRK